MRRCDLESGQFSRFQPCAAPFHYQNSSQDGLTVRARSTREHRFCHITELSHVFFIPL